MRKFKTALAVLCAAAMVIPAGTAFADEAADDGGASELTEVGTYPIYDGDEPLSFTMFRLSMPNVEDFATNDFTKYMEDLTNIHFDFETGTRDDRTEKINMEFNTGTYPDCIMYVSVDQAQWGVDEGILIQLDDLIYENMPNYVEKMGDYIDSTRAADGHIYAIAGFNDCYHCSFGRKMWVNTEYLDELGVEVPTTTDEFYDVCKKFLEKYPDKIAIGGANSGWYVDFTAWLMNAFQFDPGQSQDYDVKIAVDTDGNIVETANTDAYREGLKYLRSLYDLGAIYDGDFTQDAETLRNIMNQEDEPVLFVPFGTISDGIDAESNNELYRKYQCIAPLAGPDGTQYTTWFKYDAVEEGSFSITDKCTNPAALLRWVDYFFSEKGDISSQFGADEGVDWVWEPNDGSVGLNGEPALYKISDEAQYSSEAQNHDWQDVVIRYAPADYRLGQATDPDIDTGTSAGLEKLLYDASVMMEPYKQDPEKGDLDVLPYLKLTADEASDISTIGVEVENYIASSKVNFITGEWDINDDAAWQSYLDGLENSGLQTLLDTYQTAYDRSNGASE